MKKSNKKIISAGEGIRTPERLRETILSRSPLTAWLLPRYGITEMSEDYPVAEVYRVYQS